MSKQIGRPQKYKTPSVLMTVSIPENLLEALDTYLAGSKKRSQAVATLLAQALNVDIAVTK